jgi:hypothetical protein
MGWETRRGESYYYRKVRGDDGRVRSVYFGKGERAEAAAAEDEARRCATSDVTNIQNVKKEGVANIRHVKKDGLQQLATKKESGLAEVSGKKGGNAPPLRPYIDKSPTVRVCVNPADPEAEKLAREHFQGDWLDVWMLHGLQADGIAKAEDVRRRLPFLYIPLLDDV